MSFVLHLYADSNQLRYFLIFLANLNIHPSHPQYTKLIDSRFPVTPLGASRITMLLREYLDTTPGRISEMSPQPSLMATGFLCGYSGRITRGRFRKHPLIEGRNYAANYLPLFVYHLGCERAMATMGFGLVIIMQFYHLIPLLTIPIFLNG